VSARQEKPVEIAYVNIFVRNLETSVAFYRDILGLVPDRTDTGHGYASFRAGAVQLGLASVAGEQAALAGGHTGVGFSVGNLELEHARLTALGVRFPMPPTEQPWGGFMALFTDPDGNVFYLDQIAAAHG
jgi:predicted enzyme related to lactoylglutathione lyase